MGLTALGIKKAGDGRHGDGGGLELRKTGDGGKWVWRYSLSRRRREMGLGSYPAVSLPVRHEALELLDQRQRGSIRFHEVLAIKKPAQWQGQ